MCKARWIRNGSVAPRAGAWIETEMEEIMFFAFQSLPVRERGLKPRTERRSESRCLSLPVRERGLKQRLTLNQHILVIVAPRAGAWIETGSLPGIVSRYWSLPVRERGLKQSDPGSPGRYAGVAPRAGAWIETVSAV